MVEHRAYVCHRCNKAISTTRESLDEAWIVGGVAEGFADLIDGCAKGVVKVADSVFTPQERLQILAGDDLARPFEQGGEHLEWLALQLDLTARLPQLSRLQIRLVESKGDFRTALQSGRHRTALR